MDLFCRIISLENAAEFPIFCRTLSEALLRAGKHVRMQAQYVMLRKVQMQKRKTGTLIFLWALFFSPYLLSHILPLTKNNLTRQNYLLV